MIERGGEIHSNVLFFSLKILAVVGIKIKCEFVGVSIWLLFLCYLNRLYGFHDSSNFFFLFATWLINVSSYNCILFDCFVAGQQISLFVQYMTLLTRVIWN